MESPPPLTKTGCLLFHRLAEPRPRIHDCDTKIKREFVSMSDTDGKDEDVKNYILFLFHTCNFSIVLPLMPRNKLGTLLNLGFLIKEDF